MLNEINDIIIRAIFCQDIDCNFDILIDNTRYIDKNIVVHKSAEHINIKIMIGDKND